MDVWAFLAWLFQQIDKVLLWFGNGFWSLYTAAASAYNWAKDFAQNAYNQAVIYVIIAENYLQTVISAAKQYAVNFATDLYHEAINFANWVYDHARTLIQQAQDYAVSVATGLYNAAVKLINNGLAALETWAKDFIKAAVKVVQDLFSPLLALAPVVKSVLQLVDPKIIPQLLSLAQAFYSQIVLFFSDPLGFIFGVMWGNFVQFLCFALGYGLGSVDAQLPPIPVWGKKAAGGPVDTNPIPPIAGGSLVRPVTPLYISGYIFGPGHYGDDFGIVDGQEIHAAHAGTVVYAGWDSSGYGNRIDIDSVPYWTRYGHNKQILVSVGQQVKAGQVISDGNSTGNSSGPHLHFELKINGAYVDPLLYL
jgi:murein DD-endopeptidase MepM/ murein hydrolase activator NlpD